MTAATRSSWDSLDLKSGQPSSSVDSQDLNDGPLKFSLWSRKFPAGRSQVLVKRKGAGSFAVCMGKFFVCKFSGWTLLFVPSSVKGSCMEYGRPCMQDLSEGIFAARVSGRDTQITFGSFS